MGHSARPRAQQLRRNDADSRAQIRADTTNPNVATNDCTLEGQGCFPCVQERGLSGDNLQVRIDAGMIPDTCFVEGPCCRANRGVLLLDYLVQYADGSEVVLHLLESRENSLPIVGHSYIVGCLRLPHLRAARSSIEDGLREARPDRPEEFGPFRKSAADVLWNPPLAVNRSCAGKTGGEGAEPRGVTVEGAVLS